MNDSIWLSPWFLGAAAIWALWMVGAIYFITRNRRETKKLRAQRARLYREASERARPLPWQSPPPTWEWPDRNGNGRSADDAVRR